MQYLAHRGVSDPFYSALGVDRDSRTRIKDDSDASRPIASPCHSMISSRSRESVGGGSADLVGITDLRGPMVDQAAQTHSLVLRGQSRTFVMRLPCDLVCDLSDTSTTSMFLYCWIDGERGQGAHIHYMPVDMGDLPAEDQGHAVRHTGEFELTIPIMSEDVDLLKMMSCIRVRDETTGNYRTDVVACGAVRLDRLLAGKDVSATLNSVFDNFNFTEVRIRAANAHMFANSQSDLVPQGSGSRMLPMISFRPSSLWRMDELGDSVDLTCDTVKLQMDRCKIKGPDGGEQFLLGKTRWGARLLDQCVCFFSLFLGTPGYALVPLLTPLPRCSPAGSSAAPPSTTRPSPSARSSRITRL